MNGRLVTIFGGSGFVGRHIVNRLAKAGWKVRVAVRDPEGAKFLKPLGDLGQVSTIYANVTRDETVQAAVTGADVVINLTGILYEKGSVTFDAIHVRGAECIAREAHKADVSHLIHMSALGADPASPSLYARSKAEGEARVKAAFPEQPCYAHPLFSVPKMTSLTVLHRWPGVCRFSSISRLMPRS